MRTRDLARRAHRVIRGPARVAPSPQSANQATDWVSGAAVVRVGVLVVLGAAHRWLAGVPRGTVCTYGLSYQLDWWETTRLTRCVVDAGSSVILTRARSPGADAHGHLGMSRCYGLSLALLTHYWRRPPHASVRRLRGACQAFPTANRFCGAARR